MSKTDSQDKAIFFLGAGASVEAGAKGVVDLATEFKNRLKSKSESDFRVIEKIIAKLEEWIKEQEIHRTVDIELILDVLERLESAQKDVILEFYDNKEFILSGFKRDKHLSSELKLFVREMCFIRRERTNYLKPILLFLKHYKVLDIFSTNYDNCIEEFCDVKGINLVDGLDVSGWNVEAFANLSEGIRLYKLHGSIIWRQTKEGQYVRFPAFTTDEIIQQSSGIPMVPFILYPGKKLEYSESGIDILAELKKQLRHVKHVFVIGYSFKDEHITKLFQYAAKRNRKLTLFLVSPSAYQVYDEWLRFYRDDRFIESFSRSMTSESSSAPLASSLQGRVICLPYKFGKILPKLSKYLDDLSEAEKLDEEFMFIDAQSDIPKWKKRLNYYAECEHFERVEKILNEEGVNWDKLIVDDWKFSFGLSVKGILHYLLMSPNDKSVENQWKDYFNKVSGIFSVDKFIFIPSLGSGTVSSPHHIKLEFDTPSGKVSGDNLSEYLKRVIVPVIESKLQMVDDNAKQAKITKSLNIMRNMTAYVQLWSHENMTFQRFFDMRQNDHHDEVEQFKIRANDFSGTNQNKEGQQKVREVVEQIERVEIRRIYGADVPNII